MGKTSIEWTDLSWPVLNGCRRVSPGCRNCYAERLTATRLRNTPKYQGLATYTPKGPRWSADTRLWRKDLTMPLKLRKPSRIFVCDMGDLFYEGNTDEEIDEIFGVMWACLYLGRYGIEGHTFQVLTKRAKRMRKYLSEDRRKRWATAAVHLGGGIDPDGVFEQTMNATEPHPRIWLGVSAEDQKRADERIPLLLDTPATIRFVSAEPLLGPIDFSRWLEDNPVHVAKREERGDPVPGSGDSFGANPARLPNGSEGRTRREESGRQTDRHSDRGDSPKVPQGARDTGRNRVHLRGGAPDNLEDRAWGASDATVGPNEGLHGSPLARDARTRRDGELHLIIVGGESGHGARSCNTEWIWSIVQQCKAAGVAAFVKQVGKHPMDAAYEATDGPGPLIPIHLKHPKGADPSEWPAHLRVREFPA